MEGGKEEMGGGEERGEKEEGIDRRKVGEAGRGMGGWRK